MKITPFEKFILISLYNLWKEYGTSKVKTFEALIEEYEFKETNIRKPMKTLITAGLVDGDSYSAWITPKGVRQMEAAMPSDKNTTAREGSAQTSITMVFLKNFEQAIGKSELQSPEREIWLHGITQISQNPILLKTLETALKNTIE
ncbi:enoyl-CoA hydratase/isomerase [Candidatus Scalindua japonica]|uniref:Enoyl-CoA hydratase/isomerase n=1 Tax=Candidatus Scalindua japonica TaxID=1284222 RepID=A0A286U1L5_9BACT|nr:hypothetical protein [Candidatus Scalindua japonica]GAX62039.1 enoyl-CoA hydratase/isomerase [Candidatus Scalindua japonica]